MSAIQMMRILVKRGCVEEFIERISWEHIVITDIHDDEEGYEFFTMPSQIGYYEPIELYKKVKGLVVDVWYNCLGDVNLKPGKDKLPYKWESAKKFLANEVKSK